MKEDRRLKKLAHLLFVIGYWIRESGDIADLIWSLSFIL